MSATSAALAEDALASAGDGFELRMGLPWIRSMPLSCIRDLVVRIDSVECPVAVALGDRLVRPGDLCDETLWWFLQDRMVLRGQGRPAVGEHTVSVAFTLVVPYLQGGPGSPLTLPFRLDARLVADARARVATVSRDVGRAATLPAGWMLGASSFNWTPDLVAARRNATDIVAGIADSGIADRVELEAGSVWRSFPDPGDAEVDGLRDALAAAGGSVTVVGLSLDDFGADLRPRTDDERLRFLRPQLRAAERVGATGVRLPIGQAGRELLTALLPELEERSLTLYEELQGQQSPGSPAIAAALDLIAGLDSPRVRALVDVSLLMPALPVTYLELLAGSGLPAEFMRRIESEWRDPATGEAVLALLGSGGVPGPIHTLYMNMLIRFGRSDASELQSILPLVGAYHLKFWDLDDEDGRISAPLTDLAGTLAGTAFSGTLTSEWGGHEWLDDRDATDMTRAHLALARRALARGADRARSTAAATA